MVSAIAFIGGTISTRTSSSRSGSLTLGSCSGEFAGTGRKRNARSSSRRSPACMLRGIEAVAQHRDDHDRAPRRSRSTPRCGRPDTIRRRVRRRRRAARAARDSRSTTPAGRSPIRNANATEPVENERQDPRTRSARRRGRRDASSRSPRAGSEAARNWRARSESGEPDAIEANSKADAAPAPKPMRTICIIASCPALLERLEADRVRPNHRPAGSSRRPRAACARFNAKPVTTLLSRLADHVVQQAEEARPLDRARKLTLLLGRDRGDAARHDLAALRDVALQQLHVLVVDLRRVGAGERAGLAAAEEGAAAACVMRIAWCLLLGRCGFAGVVARTAVVAPRTAVTGRRDRSGRHGRSGRRRARRARDPGRPCASSPRGLPRARRRAP